MPLDTDSMRLRRAATRQATIVAAGYAAVGLLGVAGWPVYIDALIIVTSIVPLLVAGTEGAIGWKLYRTADARWVRWLALHQLWLVAIWALFWFYFWGLNLGPYLELIPSALWNELAVALEPAGLTVEAYLNFMWKLMLVMLAPLILAKQTWFFIRYWRRWQRLRRS